jgi:hypothetical protein
MMQMQQQQQQQQQQHQAVAAPPQSVPPGPYNPAQQIAQMNEQVWMQIGMCTKTLRRG